jgi:hypothetical protein
MRLDAVVTDGRDVESSTKSGWLAAQSMLSPFASNQFNAYPLEHVPRTVREASRSSTFTGDLGVLLLRYVLGNT